MLLSASMMLIKLWCLIRMYTRGMENTLIVYYFANILLLSNYKLAKNLRELST